MGTKSRKTLNQRLCEQFCDVFFFITKAIGLPQFCEDGTSLKRGLGIITQKLEDDIHI